MAVCRGSLLGCLGLARLGVLAAETLDASRGIDKALLAGEERVAARADFNVDVALVGRPGFKVAAAGALNHHCSVIWVDLFLRHRFGDKPFLLLFHIYSKGIRSAMQFGGVWDAKAAGFCRLMSLECGV